MLKEVVPAFLSTTNPASTQRSSSPPLVDFTLPEEDIAELSPCPSPVELLVTDHCAKVWLSSKIPVEILNAHVRHHISGAGGVSPIVRSWCMDVFHQMYLVEDFPDVPSYDFNIHRLNSDSTLQCIYIYTYICYHILLWLALIASHDISLSELKSRLMLIARRDINQKMESKNKSHKFHPCSSVISLFISTCKLNYFYMMRNNKILNVFNFFIIIFINDK